LGSLNERLYKNGETAGKAAPLKNATFSLDATLRAQKPPQRMGAAGNTALGASVLPLVPPPGVRAGAYNSHLAAAQVFNLQGHRATIYEWLLQLRFNFHTLSRLYRTFGLSLFNLNRWRNRQWYETSAISGFTADRSYITLFMHPQARSGVDHIHGMVSETIEFRSSVVPLEPETTFIFPYAFARRLMNETNCLPVRDYHEATSLSPDARSVLTTLVPKDEYQYDFPMSFTGRDIHENKPFSKHSDTEMIRALLGEMYLNTQGTLRASPVIYDKNGNFSDIVHKAWRIVWNPRTKTYDPSNGTGPRAETTVNCCEAHAIWVGESPRFPAQLEVCTFDRIEIAV